MRVLLLGTTQELLNLRWPSEAWILAIDSSEAMLRARGPRSNASMRASSVCGNWCNLPVPSQQTDLALADGSLAALSNLNSIVKVLAEVAGSLAQNGRFVVRAFVRPETAEFPEAVCDDLLSGRIGSIHAAKWRLAMSLHGTLNEGVELDAVWRAFRRAVPRTESLARRLGWSTSAVDTIDAYKGLQARYIFPTLSELRDLFSSTFSELRCHVPAYELGDRCPTLVLGKR
jgi:SAM-dependent methyltransferase